MVPEKVTVYIVGNTEFRSGFSDIADNANVRVVGLLLKHPTSGDAVLIGYVAESD
jgi:hypothetical protein